jgi:prepilin-type N-terminal cleavage/methylation domain-containing protein
MNKRHTNRQGFTLVEVLVGSFITAILLILLFRIVSGAMSAWQNGSSRLQTNADARLALDLIARDLQSFVARQTSASVNQEWLYSGRENVSVPAGSGSASLPMSWLLFFAPSVDRPPGQEGDIVALSYKVAFQDPITTNALASLRMFGLYKTMVDTTNTFVNALGKSNIHSGFWQAGAWNPTAPQSFVIPNVIDFQMTWWVRDLSVTTGTNYLYRIPPDKTVRLGNQLRIDGAVVPGKIESAEISLTLLDNQGAQRIRLVKTPAQLEDIRREFGRIYTQRVKIDY